LQIREGDFTSIMGPSGSGKTTLLNLMGCLDKPTKGSLFFQGKNITYFDDKELSLLRATEIGFVFQTFNLIPYYTVLENIKMPFIYGNKTNISDEQIQRRALHLLAELGLSQRASHYPSELSGGEQQRTAIARALIIEPSILLADEPTGNLDTKTGNEIIDIFKRLNRDGKTVILVTHNKELALMTKEIITIKDGRIAAAGPPGALRGLSGGQGKRGTCVPPGTPLCFAKDQNAGEFDG
ncbi:MAG: ABC transporter ATP-binding protein, partial [bacterium]|nr:ABC transporter ATP-binding protein [bacterium]